MKVLIVDDDGLIRDGIKLSMEIEDDFEVVGTATNGQEAFEICKTNRPDIVLMDIRMPVMDGVLGTKLIKEHFNDIKVVILTTFKDDQYIKEAIQNGAEGYILKSQSLDSIIDSLRVVASGNTVLEKGIAETLHSILKEEKKSESISYDFTDREFEVLELIAEGLSNKEISDKIFLSQGTVRNYVSGLLTKLNLRDRTQLAIFYYKHL